MRDPKKTRKPYAPPRLKSYGSVRELTRSDGDKNPGPDGSKGFYNKT